MIIENFIIENEVSIININEWDNVFLIIFIL